MPRFRLAVGQHIESDFASKETVKGRKPVKVYNTGDEFDSPHDLVKLFNVQGFSTKFIRLDDLMQKPAPVPVQAPAPQASPKR